MYYFFVFSTKFDNISLKTIFGMERQFENVNVKSNASTRDSPQIAKTIDSSQLRD